MQNNIPAITVYGTDWCSDSLRSRRVLEVEKVDFRYVDIDRDREGEAVVMQTNHGNRSVPTIFFPDGAVFVEPGGALLRSKIAELRELGLLDPPRS